MSLARRLSVKNPKISDFVGGLFEWNGCYITLFLQLAK
jgi:hypothetical protein